MKASCFAVAGNVVVMDPPLGTRYALEVLNELQELVCGVGQPSDLARAGPAGSRRVPPPDARRVAIPVHLGARFPCFGALERILCGRLILVISKEKEAARIRRGLPLRQVCEGTDHVSTKTVGRASSSRSSSPSSSTTAQPL